MHAVLATSVAPVFTRGLKTALVVLLLATSGGVVRTDAAAHPVQAQAGLAAAKAKANGATGSPTVRCAGLEPTYTRKKLARFPNRNTLCHGIWLPRPRRYFVPQGIAITGGNTAWISGFRHRKGYGKRPCQLLRVGLTTGRRVDFHRSIWGRVGAASAHLLPPRWRHPAALRAALDRRRRTSCGWSTRSSPASWLDARRVWRLESPVRGFRRGRDRQEPDRAGAVPDARSRVRPLVQHQAPDATGRARPRRTPPGQEAARRGGPHPHPDLRAGRHHGLRTALPGTVQPGLR